MLQPDTNSSSSLNKAGRVFSSPPLFLFLLAPLTLFGSDERTTPETPISRYGSFGSPRYTVVPHAELGEFVTFNKRAEEIKKKLEEMLSENSLVEIELELSNLEKHGSLSDREHLELLNATNRLRRTLWDKSTKLRSYEGFIIDGRFGGPTLEDDQKARDRYAKHKAIAEIMNKLLQDIIDLDDTPLPPEFSMPEIPPIPPSSQDLEKMYGSPYELLQTVFKNITGKDFPEGISVAEGVEFKDGNIGGQSFLEQNKIQIIYGDYALRFMFLAHEIGHLVAPIDILGATPINLVDFSLREEAAAYLFSAAACAAVPDLRLQALLLHFHERYNTSMLFQSFRGNEELHRRAIALAEALISVFGTPGEAYNHLVTTYPLDSRVETEKEENEAIFDSLEEKLPAIEKMHEKINLLLERVHLCHR